MEQPLNPSSHYFHSHRLKLHYWDYGGPDDRPPLILVHGTQDHARSWDDFAREFRREYHVYALDLRGHGDSAWVEGAMYAFPEFMLDLVAFGGVVQRFPAAIVGHSLGGIVAMHYAGAFPERVAAVVNIEGWGPPPATRTKTYTERLRTWAERVLAAESRTPRRYASIEEATARMKEANPHLSDAMAAHLTRYGTNRTADGSLIWKFDPYLRNLPRWACQPNWPGNSSRLCNARYCASGARKAGQPIWPRVRSFR
ncbi:alpha/beta hydrolase [Chloracidobacterium sp. S]|nr:alpha/beta hydrolase [Chloracidobacterium aggregatum]QUV89167.1 alpha/beta hydrolase [Chloracidobacterium sp. S]